MVICLFFNPSIGTYQGDPLGGPFFALIHFRAFHNLTALFPSCLFPSIVDYTHIIGPAFVLS